MIKPLHQRDVEHYSDYLLFFLSRYSREGLAYKEEIKTGKCINLTVVHKSVHAGR